MTLERMLASNRFSPIIIIINTITVQTLYIDYTRTLLMIIYVHYI